MTAKNFMLAIAWSVRKGLQYLLGGEAEGSESGVWCGARMRVQKKAAAALLYVCLAAVLSMRSCTMLAHDCALLP